MANSVPNEHQDGAAFEHDGGRPMDGAWIGLFEPEKDTIGGLFGLVGQMTHDPERGRYYAVAGWPLSTLDDVLVVASGPTARECHNKLDAGAREVLRLMQRASRSIPVMPNDRPAVGDRYRGGRVIRTRLDEVGRARQAWIFNANEEAA
jgi:hypothetical protein